MKLEDISYQDISYFIAVAEELNYRKAAERLSIKYNFDLDPSCLSKHISSLEKKLRCELFANPGRSTQLTPAGRVFLEDAYGLVEQIERVIRRAYRASMGELGDLAIAINSSICNSILPELLRNFRQERPDVNLVLHELGPQEQIQQLRDYKIDLGFDFLPHDIHPDLQYSIILREPLIIALPESHQLAVKAQIPLQDLENESFILPSPKVAPFYQQIIHFCEKNFGHELNIVQEANWMVTVLSLVSGELGLSILLRNAQNIQRQGVIYRPIQGDNLKIDIVALWRRDDSSAVLQEFLQVLNNIVNVIDQ